ncbi:MAG: ImmA/IrrE family metallo-endopeptidase [Alphaproteobacteria bacterium]|nr:ImmA/IrrE family metallo-endopeptidase [Alphaproteobacteria bacterium]
MTNRAFNPNWASPPGATIRDLLECRAKTKEWLSAAIGCSTKDVEDLIEGHMPLDHKLALLLEFYLGPSAKFWLARERRYRAVDRQEPRRGLSKEESAWVSQFPIREMEKYGWIEPTSSETEAYSQCLDFFGVQTAKNWELQYRSEISVAAFRTSSTYQSNLTSVLAWLRQSQIQGARIECGEWNRAKFLKTLNDLRRLTWISDPKIFLPRLVDACAKCGVAVVVTRAPSACKVSGATRFISPRKALIALSFRHLSDDHFWFTFYHESAHLLLHNMDAIFLEDQSDVTDEEETEANEFASEKLVPQSALSMLSANRITPKSILNFSKSIGIAPGIVVGQLQHRAIVDRRNLNYLKRRFRWSEYSTIEKANL